MQPDIFKKKYENCAQVDEDIEKLENEIPDKRTKEYREWKEKMNYLFLLYNKFVKFKAFAPIR